MIKKMIVPAFVFALFATAANAQESAAPAQAEPTATTAPAAGDAAGDNKTKIEASALPEGVKTALASDSYKEWQLVSAWLVKDKTEYYQLEMQKGTEKTTLKLNKDGKQI